MAKCSMKTSKPMYANVVIRDNRRMYSSFGFDLNSMIEAAEQYNHGVVAIELAHAGKPPVWVREDVQVTI